MDEDLLASRIDAPTEVYDRIPNTTDRLRRLARDGAPHGTMVVANELTAARGRTGNVWSAPPGGVWTSVLLRPAVGPDQVGRLTFAAGVAVADAIDSFGPSARLKWPNDVVVGGSKVAGILTESVHDGVPVAGKPVDEVFPGEETTLDYVVLGIGVNANVDPERIDADRPVTSLRAETGSDVDRASVAARVHGEVLERCGQAETSEGFASLLEEWRGMSETLGASVRVERRGRASVEGVARDVTETGALVVETDDGDVEVTEGECRRLRRQSLDGGEKR